MAWFVLHFRFKIDSSDYSAYYPTQLVNKNYETVCAVFASLNGDATTAVAVEATKSIYI